MRVPKTQPFVPVILGGDIGTYSLAREFHEAYGAVSVAVPAASNGVLEHSVAIDVRPAGTMVDDDVVVAHLQGIARELTADGANPRPLLLCGSLDLQVMLLARRRADLEQWYTIPYVPLEKMEQAALKQNFYELCTELGVPHPRTLAVDMAAYAAGGWQVPEDLPFPLVGKPADSSAWVHARFEGKQKIHTLTDRSELAHLLDRISGSGYREAFILQELVPGGDTNMRLCTFFSGGDGLVRFAAYGEVVVEEHAPLVLGNSAGIVTAVEPEVIAQGRRILDHLGWTGFGMFDAKLDPRDGVVKFFELNPRLGRNHYYLTAAGRNAARFYVREYLGEEYDAGARPGAAAASGAQLSKGLAGAEGLEGIDVLRTEWLYTVLPLPLLRRHARGPVGSKALRLITEKKVSNPLLYKAERHPRRLVYLALTMLNQFRKFHQFPPRRA